MVRLGLLLYLALMTATGPGLCCCLASQAVDILGKDTKPAHPCCPGHQPTNKETPSKYPSAPCPCQETRFDSNVGRTSERLDASVELRQQACVAFVSLLPTDSNSDGSNPTNRSGSAAPAFLDGKDILRALHILRC